MFARLLWFTITISLLVSLVGCNPVITDCGGHIREHFEKYSRSLEFAPI